MSKEAVTHVDGLIGKVFGNLEMFTQELSRSIPLPIGTSDAKSLRNSDKAPTSRNIHIHSYVIFRNGMCVVSIAVSNSLAEKSRSR